MSQIVPTRTDLASYDQTVELAGAAFGMRFRHNAREDSWYVDLLDEAGAPLREGLRCVPNWPLLRTMVSVSRPNGDLIVVDARAVPEAPGLEELGSQTFLVFSEA